MRQTCRKPRRGFWWMESYRRCGCLNVQKRKCDLPGYCPVHAFAANPQKLPITPSDDITIGITPED